jgi:hypothetical protein
MNKYVKLTLLSRLVLENSRLLLEMDWLNDKTLKKRMKNG